MTTTTERKHCVICGHEGYDVSHFQNYIGGVGYVWQDECVNLVECRHRRGWDNNGKAETDYLDRKLEQERERREIA